MMQSFEVHKTAPFHLLCVPVYSTYVVRIAYIEFVQYVWPTESHVLWNLVNMYLVKYNVIHIPGISTPHSVPVYTSCT